MRTLIEQTRHFALPVDKFVGDERGIIVIVGPEHQRRFLDDGWTKEAVRDRIFEGVTKPRVGNYDEQLVLASPSNVLVVAAGGPGIAQSHVITPHLGAPTHEKVR